MHYEIRVDGVLDQSWSSWFNDLRIEPSPEGTTTISGDIVDQAALHGVLTKIRDLGLTLLSVEADDGVPRSGQT